MASAASHLEVTVREALLKVPLDPSSYSLDDEELEFFKTQTGINDEDKLREHILKVQRDAYYAIYPYPCIRRFSFMRLKISRLPAYPRLLTLAKERKGAIFLELGTCFGNDLRKVVADGFPIGNVIGSDIEPAFWQLGHSLFNSSPDGFPAAFIAGDVFDPAFLEPHAIYKSQSGSPLPDLKAVSSLNQLRGHVSVIHASAFFHLFEEKQRRELARTVASLLLPEPGSMILGIHAAALQKGMMKVPVTGEGGKPFEMFCDSPESWTESWEAIFGPGKVEVRTELREVANATKIGLVPEGMILYEMTWSVVRL